MKNNSITAHIGLPVVAILLLASLAGAWGAGGASMAAPPAASPTPWLQQDARSRIVALKAAGLGWTAYYMGDYAEAEAQFNIVIERDPAWTEGYMGRAMTYMLQERWAESERDLTKVIERDPNDAALYSGFRAYVRNYMGDFQGALEDCDRAEVLNPRLRSDYSNRGWIHGNLGDYEQAAADYTYAMTLEPTQAYYYFQRANFYEVLWRLNESEMDGYLTRGYRSFGCAMCTDAITYFTLAANYVPASGERPPDITYAYAWYGLGRQYLASSEYAQALDAFQKASALAPALPHPLAWAGEASTALGDATAAADYYARALAANPQYPEGYLLRARALDAGGQHDAALADYREWVRLMEARDVPWDFFTPGVPFVLALDETFVYHVPVWVKAGQTLTVTVERIRTPENNASPLVLALNPEGQTMAGDAVASDFDESAGLELTLPVTGSYTLLITHLAEANGAARVTISLNSN